VNGLSGSSFFRPPVSEPVNNKALIAAEIFRPRGRRFGCAAYGNKHVVSFVLSLLFVRGVSAVVFAIAFIVVNSFYRKIVRAFAHIREEPLECEPFFADGYSSAAIIWVRKIFFVSASLYYTRPNIVRSCSCHSMGRESRSAGVCSKAATRFGCSASKASYCRNNLIPAVAQTSPECDSFSRWRGNGVKVYSDEPPKPLASYVDPVGADSVTSAGFSVTITKLSRLHNGFIAAITCAVPLAVSRVRNSSKFIKLFSSDIMPWSHWLTSIKSLVRGRLFEQPVPAY
jgi:hypothetical protein